MTPRLFKHKQLPVGFNAATPVHPQDKCVHELFESQVEQNSEAIAVVFEDKRLTYRDLNTRANQLARFLRRFGVGPNTLVGLCVQRSLEMIVGILGILKAGAAYVPLDPSHARDKLSLIMQDSNVFVLLTQSHLLEAIPRHQGPRLSLDSDWAVIAKEKKANPARRATTRNLAYVIYTSAPFGPPKGVMISHRGLVNYLSWVAEAYEVVKNPGATIDSSIPFELAITRVLSPLMVGRSVMLVGDIYEDVIPGTH